MTAPTTDVRDRAQTGPVLDLPQAATLVHVPRGAEGEARRESAPEPEPPPVAGMRFTREQVELIKRTIAKGTTDDELQLFIMQCERTGLDPFARQIYCVKRWDSQLEREVAQTQISIDGARLIAERTEKYAGQLPVLWAKVYGFDVTGGDPAIRWFDVWPFPDEAPYAAKARILRTDFREPMEAVARFDAYKQTKRGGTLTHMWQKMPDVMIAKVAEMLGLRKAFPHELRGLYSTDEMGQADNDRPEDADRSGGTGEGRSRAGSTRTSHGSAIGDSAPSGTTTETRVATEPDARCPKCAGPMYHNRARKAAGQMKPKAPDFKCRDRDCDGLFWPGQWPPKSEKQDAEGSASAPATASAPHGAAQPGPAAGGADSAAAVPTKFVDNFPVKRLRGRVIAECPDADIAEALDAALRYKSAKWEQLLSDELEARRARGVQDAAAESIPDPVAAAAEQAKGAKQAKRRGGKQAVSLGDLPWEEPLDTAPAPDTNALAQP